MAVLELNEEEAEALQGQLDLDIDSWKDQLATICKQPFDTWEELLEHSNFSSDMIEKLTKMRNDLYEQRAGRNPAA